MHLACFALHVIIKSRLLDRIYISFFRITGRYIYLTRHTRTLAGRLYIIGACACMLGAACLSALSSQRSTCMHAPADKHSGSASSLSLLISVHLRPRVVLASRRIETGCLLLEGLRRVASRRIETTGREEDWRRLTDRNCGWLVRPQTFPPPCSLVVILIPP
jgi:hypothetical protein